MMSVKKHSLIMALVQGGIWLAVGVGLTAALMFPNFNQNGQISPMAAAIAITTGAFFGGIISAFGAVNTARKDWLAGKVQLDDPPAPPAPPRKPMFLVPTLDSVLQWLPFAVLTYAVAVGLFKAGLSRPVFIALGAIIMGAHGALAAFRNSGRELKKYALNPPGAPAQFKPYVLLEHVSGNASINLFINFIITYAIFHSPEAPGAPVAFAALCPDVLILGFMVAVLVPIGAAMQADNDVREKRLVPPGAGAPGLLLRNLAFVAVSELMVLLTLAAIYVLGKDSISIWTAMTIKGLLSAVIAGVVAFMAARWSARAAASKP